MAGYQGTKINPSRFHPTQLAFYAYLVPLALFMILPIVFITAHAFKPLDELFAFPPRFFVLRPTLRNFVDLFQKTQAGDTLNVPMTRYLFNSLVVSGVVVLVTVLVAAMGGYALSKKRFRARSLLFEINTLALMFVPAAVSIPRYLIVARLGMVDTLFAHVLPLLAMPIGLFLVKQFIDQVPDSLIEAARIDGAGDWQIFRRIVVPAITPALATVAILAFQSVWNNVETSSYYVDEDSLRTFAFYMSTVVQSGAAANAVNPVAGQGMAAAGGLIMFIPNLVIFILMQSRVMNTMVHSGIK
jgi:ABC-type glycerol-3-phosphate transport system permease component